MSTKEQWAAELQENLTKALRNHIGRPLTPDRRKIVERELADFAKGLSVPPDLKPVDITIEPDGSLMIRIISRG